MKPVCYTDPGERRGADTASAKGQEDLRRGGNRLRGSKSDRGHQASPATLKGSGSYFLYNKLEQRQNCGKSKE